LVVIVPIASGNRAAGFRTDRCTFIRVRDRGFALLEALIAAALLITLAACVSRIVAAVVREGHASRLRAGATVAAADKAEELRSLDRADLMSGFDYLDAAGASVGSETPAPGSAVYIRRWTIQPLDGDTEVFTLRVEVFTRDGSLSARLVTVRALR
jgi:hypothetical protein